MNHASLFSGIGGFDLAAEWMGWTNIFNCDIEEFPRKVLKYHFPNATQYADIKQTDFTIHRGEVDILTGGFPCQPFSMAGKRLGKNDERHLWPEMYRAIREIKPKWIVGENVRGLLNWSDGLVLDEVYADLGNEGYEIESFVLPAAGINAPHKRDRVWIVANSKGIRSGNWKPENNNSGEWLLEESLTDNRSEIRSWSEGYSNIITNTNNNGQTATEVGQGMGERNDSNKTRKIESIESSGRSIQETRVNSDTDLQRCKERHIPSESREEERQYCKKNHFGQEYKTWFDFPTQSPICGGDDGFPGELDGITVSKWRTESIKAYGNAIVPQIAYRIFKAIEQVELDTN